MKFIFLLFFVSVGSSATYLTQYSTEDGVQYLSKLNPENGTQTLKIKLGHAINDASLIFTGKKNKLLAVLLQQKDESDYIVILDKNTLKEKTRIPVPKVKWPDTKGLEIPPILLSTDDSKLVVISQIQSNLFINIYDVASNEVLFTKNLGKTDYVISQSDDLNFVTFESLSAKKRIFIAIDVAKAKTTAIANLGYAPVKTFMHANSVYISTERSPRKNKYYSLSRLEFTTNKKTEFEFKSLMPFTFAHNSVQTRLYIVGQNTRKKKGLYALELQKDKSLNQTLFKKKVRPLEAVLNDNETKLMVIGKFKLAVIDTETQTLTSRIRIPFDPKQGIMNRTGTLAYVQENNGSEVAVFDLLKGKLIEQSSAGRVLSHVLVSARKIVAPNIFSGVIPSAVYSLLEGRRSQKLLKLNKQETQLYVINESTNDLSIFDAETLKKRIAIGTGAETYFMSQGDNKESPILIVGKNRITLIDSQSHAPILKLQDTEMKGLDKNNDLLFYSNQNTLHAYDMLNKKELSTISNLKILAVYVY